MNSRADVTSYGCRSLKKLGQRETAASQRKRNRDCAIPGELGIEREGERIFFKFSVCDNFPLKGTPL